MAETDEKTKTFADFMKKKNKGSAGKTGTDDAAKALEERRKESKVPKLQGLDEDQSEDLVSALSVFSSPPTGSEQTPSGSASGASLVGLAQAIKQRQTNKEAQQLAMKKAQEEAERQERLDRILAKMDTESN